MRLIDADALKEVLELSKYIVSNDLNRLLNSEINRCIEAIDYAPTVEPEVKEVPIANVTFDTEKLKELTDGIVERIKNGEIVLQDERLKGEWISNYQGESFINRGRHCSLCGKVAEFSENFCPNCGADMRKDEDQEKGGENK